MHAAYFIPPPPKKKEAKPPIIFQFLVFLAYNLEVLLKFSETCSEKYLNRLLIMRYLKISETFLNTSLKDLKSSVLYRFLCPG